LFGIGTVVILALVPLVGPLVIPNLESELTLTADRYLSYVLTVTVLVAGLMYAAEQQHLWNGLDVHVSRIVGRTTLSLTLIAVVLLDVVIWIALLSDRAIRNKVIVASLIFHLLWAACAVWLRRSGSTSTFIAVCGGFLGAVIVTTGAVVAIN